MSDLRPEDRLTRKSTDGLAEYVCGLVDRWENKRDVMYRNRWEEYARMWKGEWSASDRERQSERSKAIMPAISQAVDSAVSEVEEALFSQERWFDLDSDNPATPQDEGGPGRQMADQLLDDLSRTKAAVSEAVLLAAIYGTGIGKVVVHEKTDQTIGIELVPVEPLEFVIDPGAETIEEAQGVCHNFTLPYNVVLERQRQGIYEKVDPRIGVEPGEERHIDADIVYIKEYQGLVPRKMLPDVEDPPEKLAYEEDAPVEAIVTIANNDVVLRARENPLPLKDRGFIAFQWSTNPGHFWGRGVVEQGYWPQKVLDSEVRARIDALAFSVHPMMAINAAAAPRGADFAVRPGRNIFLNGNPSEVMQPVNFPPPDPQTYVQAQEMQRQIEMATGQLQAATPFNSNGRNETASGMSMMLGASIRRTRKTMANIERSFMTPFLEKVIERFVEFDARYPQAFPVKVLGALGMMAKEFESMQLSQLLNSLPPGPASFAILRSIIDNTGLTDKQNLLRLMDILTAESMEPPPPQRDLGGEARLISAQTRQQEVGINAQLDEQRLQLETAKVQLQALESRRTNEREMMRLSVDAERVESEDMKRTADSILSLAKAEAEEIGKQMDEYRRALAEMQTVTVSQAPTEEEQQQAVDISSLQAELDELREKLDQAAQASEGLDADDIVPIEIERNSDGLVTSINGRSISRDDKGLIVGIQ